LSLLYSVSSVNKPTWDNPFIELLMVIRWMDRNN